MRNFRGILSHARPILLYYNTPMLFPTFKVHKPLNNSITIVLFGFMPRYKDQINLQRRRELGYGDTMSSAEIDAIILREETPVNYAFSTLCDVELII